MKIKTIQRIHQPTIKEFDRYITQNQPVIITGVANQWEAYNNWTPELFKHMFGELTVPVRPTDNEINLFFAEDDRKKLLRFADYIDLITNWNSPNQRPPYFGNIFLDEPEVRPIVEPILQDFDFPNYFTDSNRNDVHLWIGAAEQKSTIHNDNYENLNAQIYGKKAFLLFSPEQHPFLYPVKIDDELWSSPIDPQNPDLIKYPLFDRTSCLEAVLEPGEILFIPVFWWHQARSITTAINLNMWAFTKKVSEYWNEDNPIFRNCVNTVISH
jgi:lysine-specific demethylase 8